MDEWGNDDNYEDFGADSFDDSNEFGSGYQVHNGEDSFIDDRGDIYGGSAGADDWSRAVGESDIVNREIAQYERELAAQEETGNSPDTLEGKATTGDLLFGRSMHSDAATRQAQKDFLLGDTTLGLSAEDAQAARQEFASTIEGNPRAWAKRVNVNPQHLPSDITAISPAGYSVAGVELDPRFGIDPETRKYRRGSERLYSPASGGDALLTTPSEYGAKTISSALGMISGESTSRYLDQGPGGKLVGNYGNNIEKQLEVNQDLALAKNLMGGLVDLYIHPETVGSPREKGLRQQVENALTTRLIDGVFTDGARSVLPMPNELGITGLKPTMSFGSGKIGDRWAQDTTAQTRVEFESLAQTKGWTTQNPEYWEHKPNIKGSLFGKMPKGLDDAQRDAFKAAQESKLERWVDNAHAVREILRKESPTHRDESAGQMRMAGFDRPYDEQEAKANLMNEAALLGLEHGQVSEEDMTQDMTAAEIEKYGKGSSRATMYGEKTLSEIDVFVEKGMEAGPAVEVDPDFEGIPQRTPEWFAARKDLVTASLLLDFKNGKTRTPEQLAAAITKPEEFLGNAYTKEGELGESLVRASFLKHLNKDENGNPYSHKDVGLIVGQGRHDGMGASPDGKVYKDGKPDGLAEFKYLTSSGMKNTKKYNDQMQMQMMITGEDKVHFYALNKYTGASEYRIVKADPKKQEALRNDINKARELSGSLTATQVKEIEMAEQGNFSAEENAGTVAQTEPVADVTVEADTPMPVVEDVSVAPTTAAEINDRAEILAKQERREYVKSVERGFESVDDMRKFDSADAAGKAEQKKEEGLRKKAQQYRDQQEKEAAEAARERAKADKEAAKATKEFRTSLKTVLSGLAGAAINAGESGMDTVRAAAMAGFSAEDVRGTEFALVEQGNLTETQARNVTNQAAKVQAAFNDPRAVGGAYSEMFANWESRGLGKSLGALPSMGEIAKSGIGYVDMVQGFLNQAPDTVEGRKDRAWAASIMGVPELAISDIEGDVVKSADGFDSEGLREFNEGVKSVQQSVQTLAESLAAASGQVGGVAAAGTQAALNATPVLGAGANVVSGLAGGALATGAASVLAKGAAVKGGISAAALATGAASVLAKGAAVKGGISAAALAAGPTALAASAAGVAVAGAGAVGYGAGSLISEALPQGANDWIGEKLTEIAAAVGVESAQVSLDRMESVGSMSEIKGDPVVSNSRGGRSGRVNNTNVTVNVDPDMVRTIVDQDGDQYMDQEMIHGS